MSTTFRTSKHPPDVPPVQDAFTEMMADAYEKFYGLATTMPLRYLRISLPWEGTLRTRINVTVSMLVTQPSLCSSRNVSQQVLLAK